MNQLGRLLLRHSGKCLSTAAANKHTLPALPYAYDALQPIISREIMELHHTKHHQAYVNNLNAAEEKCKEAVQKGDVNTVIKLQSAIRFNGGGHLNHSIFWNNLSPHGGGAPSGDLLEAIVHDFGSFEAFRKNLSERTVAIQGSGWGWLAYNPASKRLRLLAMHNQDPVFPLEAMVPLLGIDVWEHAYYLQYKNARPDYVHAIWNIVNWKDVEQRYANARLNY